MIDELPPPLIEVSLGDIEEEEAEDDTIIVVIVFFVGIIIEPSSSFVPSALLMNCFNELIR